jgi:hypothetical protein
VTACVCCSSCVHELAPARLHAVASFLLTRLRRRARLGGSHNRSGDRMKEEAFR